MDEFRRARADKAFLPAMGGPKVPAELIEQAERVFGNKEAARARFGRPNLNLLGRRPLDEIESGGEVTVAGDA